MRNTWSTEMCLGNVLPSNKNYNNLKPRSEFRLVIMATNKLGMGGDSYSRGFCILNVLIGTSSRHNGVIQTCTILYSLITRWRGTGLHECLMTDMNSWVGGVHVQNEVIKLGMHARYSNVIGGRVASKEKSFGKC